MAIRSQRFCLHPGCNALTDKGYCPAHQPDAYTQSQRRYDAKRGTATARGYDSRWHKFRAWYLSQPEHQFCALHISPKCAGVAQCVDHIKPLEGLHDPGRFDPDNLQPACLACNTLKGSRTMRGTWKYGE